MKITSLDLAIAAALANLDTNTLPTGFCMLGTTVGFSPQLRCGIDAYIDYVFIADGGRAMVGITDNRGTNSWPIGGMSTTPRTQVLTLLGVTEPTTSPAYEAYRANRADGGFMAMNFFTWEMNNQPTGNW